MTADWTQDLKTRVDCRDVAEALGLPRQRDGRRWCPVCQATGSHTTPDLSVSERGWQCFKCGRKGDVLALVQTARGGDFRQAVELVAGLAGVSLPDDWRQAPAREEAPRPRREDPPQVGQAREDRQAPEVPEADRIRALSAFVDALPKVNGPELAYLLERGYSFDAIRTADVRGLPPGTFPTAVSAAEAATCREAVKAAGLRALYAYEAEQVGAVVFVYRQADRPVYLKARAALDKRALEARGLGALRCRNTGGTVPAPFHIDVIERSQGQVLLCEGETDVLAALTMGHQAVGVPGARVFRPEWAALFGGRDVVLAFDADEAGRKGAAQVRQVFLEAGARAPTVLELPEGQDLSDHLRALKAQGPAEPAPGVPAFPIEEDEPIPALIRQAAAALAERTPHGWLSAMMTPEDAAAIDQAEDEIGRVATAPGATVATVRPVVEKWYRLQLGAFRRRVRPPPCPRLGGVA